MDNTPYIFCVRRLHEVTPGCVTQCQGCGFLQQYPEAYPPQSVRPEGTENLTGFGPEADLASSSGHPRSDPQPRLPDVCSVCGSRAGVDTCLSKGNPGCPDPATSAVRRTGQIMRRLKPVVVNGREWRTYTCSYDTPDGKFCFEIMAISMEHAAAMLADLKENAVLDGELDTIIPVGDQ